MWTVNGYADDCDIEYDYGLILCTRSFVTATDICTCLFTLLNPNDPSLSIYTCSFKNQKFDWPNGRISNVQKRRDDYVRTDETKCQ